MGTRSSSSRCSPCSPRAARASARSSCRPRSRRCSPRGSTSLDAGGAPRRSSAPPIEGEMFHVGAVVELFAPRRADAVASQLMGLVRKELIRPERPTLPGQEAFGFRHALIRDAAYASLPKQARSDLHERYAAWLERSARRPRRGGRGVPRLPPRAGPPLPRRARQSWMKRPTLSPREPASLLASAGRRAFMRGDWPATVNLCERALALLAGESPCAASSCPTSRSRSSRSGSMERADAVAAEAMAAAEAAGDRAVRARAAVTRTYCGTYLRAEPPRRSGHAPGGRAGLCHLRRAGRRRGTHARDLQHRHRRVGIRERR